MKRLGVQTNKRQGRTRHLPGITTLRNIFNIFYRWCKSTRCFLRLSLILRRDLRSGPDYAASALPVSSRPFLDAYKSYKHYANNLVGFWKAQKLVQGQEDSLQTFIDSINAEIAKRENSLTSRSLPPPPHQPGVGGDLWGIGPRVSGPWGAQTASSARAGKNKKFEKKYLKEIFLL